MSPIIPLKKNYGKLLFICSNSFFGFSFRQVASAWTRAPRSRWVGKHGRPCGWGMVADKITQKHPTRRGRGARGPRPPRRGALVVVTRCRCPSRSSRSSATVGLASHKKKSTLNRQRAHSTTEAATTRGDRAEQDGTHGTATATTRQPADAPKRQPTATRSAEHQRRQHAQAASKHHRRRDATTTRTTERPRGTAKASEQPPTANGTRKRQDASGRQSEQRTRRRHPPPTACPMTATAANQHKKATATKPPPPQSEQTTNGTRKHGQQVRRAGYGERKGATARL